MARDDFDQFDVDGFHAESVAAEVGQLVVGEADDVLLARLDKLFFGQVGVLHVVEVEEDVLPVRIAHQEAVVVILEEELEGARHLHQIGVHWLHLGAALDVDAGDVVYSDEGP